jgi:mono/diheme cytochrome c family protein
MRRASLLFLAVSLLLLAAACGGAEDKTTAPEGVEGTTPAADTGGGDTGGGTDTGEGGGGEGDAEAGAAVFTSAGCGSCHTFAAAGTSGTTGPNLDDAAPSFESAQAQVANGGGGMPPYEGQLSEEEIANVAAYVAENAGQ